MSFLNSFIGILACKGLRTILYLAILLWKINLLLTFSTSVITISNLIVYVWEGIYIWKTKNGYNNPKESFSLDGI